MFFVKNKVYIAQSPENQDKKNVTAEKGAKAHYRKQSNLEFDFF